MCGLPDYISWPVDGIGYEDGMGEGRILRRYMFHGSLTVRRADGETKRKEFAQNRGVSENRWYGTD